MGWHRLGALMFGLALLAGKAWAIVGADTDGIWVQTLWKDKVELTNIEAAKECQTKNPQ
jgi:hypothetical protein